MGLKTRIFSKYFTVKFNSENSVSGTKRNLSDITFTFVELIT
jgi:hypothetical protein